MIRFRLPRDAVEAALAVGLLGTNHTRALYSWFDEDTDLFTASKRASFETLAKNFTRIAARQTLAELRNSKSFAAWRTVAEAGVTDSRLQDHILDWASRNALHVKIKRFSHRQPTPPDEDEALVFARYKWEGFISEFLRAAAYVALRDDLFGRVAAAPPRSRGAPNENQSRRDRRPTGNRGPSRAAASRPAAPERTQMRDVDRLAIRSKPHAI